MKNCLLIAGEKSGEEHVLTFLPKLRSLFPEIHFFGVGGDELTKQQMELLYHLRDFSGWGFTEVLGKIPFYLKALNHILDEVDKRQCRVAILVDFQEFNFRLARKLKKRGVQVLYYVAPQAWAWREWRATVLGEIVHTLFTIIPFEKSWFKARGVQRICSIPHPVLFRTKQEIITRGLDWESILEERSTRRLPTYRFCTNYSTSNLCGINANCSTTVMPTFDYERPLRLLILPGSRKHEVASLLPEFLSAVKELKKIYSYPIQLLIVESPSVSATIYKEYRSQFDEIYNSSELIPALLGADFCLAASGTVTLTAALLNVPTVVCYQVSLITEWVYKFWVNYDGPISLANIILQERVFPELLQDKVDRINICTCLQEWLTDYIEYEKIKKKLKMVPHSLEGDNISISDYIGQVITEVYLKDVS